MSLLKRIFGKKKDVLLDPIDLGANLITDVHSHFIPGIDDGAETLEDSIELIQGLVDLGYKKIVTTPHIMSDYYRNTPEIIIDGLQKVRAEISRLNIPVEFEAAAEYNLDAEFEALIDSDNLLTFGDNYLLFELPFLQEPHVLKDIIWKLQTKGYKPVLAHVERYPFWHNDFDKIEDVKNRGVMIQVNIGSFTGAYGPHVKAIAEKLVDLGWVDMLGTDCHHTRHLDLIKKARQYPSLQKAVNFPHLINKKL